jgi:hypothetical protein
MNNLTADLLGWVGATALLIAYGLISAGKVRARNRSYQGLNVAGSMGLIVNSTWYGAYPSTALNVIWIAIALITLLKISKSPPN